MKFQSAITSLAAVALASSSLDSVSSFVPKSCSKISPAATLPASQSYSKIGQHQSITQLHVASSEIVGDEADVKPRKTREERLQAASKGLQVHCVGLSIHHADVEVREKLAVAECDWNAASNEICSTGDIAESAVLSTCNRFEIYYTATDPRAAMASVTKFLAQRSGLPVSELRKNLSCFLGTTLFGIL